MMMDLKMKSKHDFMEEWTIRKRNRVRRRNKNLLIVWCGGTGEGKSWGAGRVGEKIDPTFIDCINDNGIHSRIAWGKPLRFMKMLNKGIDDKTIKKGSVIIFDEAGVGMPAREWYSQSNKMFSYVIQTFRNLNLCVIFTVPHLSFIDSQPRKLFHNFIDSKTINLEKRYSRITIQKMSVNSKEDKIYYPYPRFHGIKIKGFYLNAPHDDFIKLYEPASNEFKEELRKEAEAEMETDKAKKSLLKQTDIAIMKQIKKEDMALNAYLLQFKFNIGKDRAYRIIKNYNLLSSEL